MNMLRRRLLAGRDGCAEDSRLRSSATTRLLRRPSRVALAPTGTAAGAARSPAQTQPNACACVRVRAHVRACVRVRAHVRACARARVCVFVGRSVCPSHHTVGGGWPPPRRAREWTAHTARRPPRVSSPRLPNRPHSHQHPRQPPTFTATHPKTTGVSAPSTTSSTWPRLRSDRIGECGAPPCGRPNVLPNQSLAVTGTSCAGGWDLVARCNRYELRWRVGPRRSLKPGRGALAGGTSLGLPRSSGVTN